MQGVPSGSTSGGSTGKQVSLMLMRQQRLQASTMMSHMQLCKPCVSQYGTHLPLRHWPRSWQMVPSAMAGDLGHSAWEPVQRASCSQVAYCASRHFIAAGMNWQFWQHGEFLSLHMAPWLRRSLQFLSQHESLSSVPSRPASHCSSPSTRKLPQNDSSGSEKQRPDLACRTLRMERREQGENFYQGMGKVRDMETLSTLSVRLPCCSRRSHWRNMCTLESCRLARRWVSIRVCRDRVRSPSCVRIHEQLPGQPRALSHAGHNDCVSCLGQSSNRECSRSWSILNGEEIW